MLVCTYSAVLSADGGVAHCLHPVKNTIRRRTVSSLKRFENSDTKFLKFQEDFIENEAGKHVSYKLCEAQLAFHGSTTIHEHPKR